MVKEEIDVMAVIEEIEAIEVIEEEEAVEARSTNRNHTNKETTMAVPAISIINQRPLDKEASRKPAHHRLGM